MTETVDLRALVADVRGGLGQRHGLPLAIEDDAGRALGELVPLTEALVDAALCHELHAWRARHAGLFLSVFENSPARVEQWLREIVLPDLSRVPFLIRGPEGAWLGNHGLTGMTGSGAELDTMMRGASGGGPDLMHRAQLVLLHWCFGVLGLEYVVGRVLARNFLVRRFHRGFDFTEERHEPLRRRDGADGYALVPDAGATLADCDEVLVHIRLRRQDFWARFGRPADGHAAGRSRPGRGA